MEDHCCLLCSLLLGYGLDAYVCMGTKTNGHAHCWVVTIGNEGGVTFWESLTGQRREKLLYVFSSDVKKLNICHFMSDVCFRYRHVPFDPNNQAGAPPTSPTHPYRTVGCLFNHASFLANTQPSDSALTCRFDLWNRSLWKRMSSEALLSIPRQRRDQVSYLPSYYMGTVYSSGF